MFSTVFLVPGGMSRMTRPAQRRKGTSCQPPTASSPWQTPQRRLRAPSQVFKSPNADGNDSHWALGPCSRDRMRSTVKTTTMPPLMLQGLDMCKGCRRRTVASTCFLLLFEKRAGRWARKKKLFRYFAKRNETKVVSFSYGKENCSVS